MFGEEIIKLDIQVDNDDWQALLNNAQAKEWISGDLIINGERFGNVGIRAKGNSSLSMGMRSDDARYSLQFKFNKYVKGQTYYGLDTFCINNLMGDATYMKDYISYEIMHYIGVATPLVNYANVTVNDTSYGFCTALERYDKAFLDRVYSTSAGQLYNVKIGMGMRGNFEDMWQDIPNEMPDRQPGNRGADGGMGMGGFGGRNGDGMGMGGFGGRNGGGSLVYTDDSISSYSAIFDNAIFNASDKDKLRVIKALENLGAGTDLEKYFDVDEILRYFAAHTFVVNLDSYTSNMQQNYYIYERDGKITVLPWDYGLAFGGFQSGNASSVVNFPIDTPVSGVNMEDRPLLNKLLEVDEYRERYHEYLRQIVEVYVEGGLFESTINAIDAKINKYVKNDVSAFYTYEQYEAALPQLIKLCRFRAESIKGQLAGTIPSTSSGQNADSSTLIDASSLDLTALGSMMGGGRMGEGGRQDWQGGQPDGQDRMPSFPDGWPDGQQPGNQGGQPGDRQPGGQGDNPRGGGFMPGGGMIDMELMRQAMQILMDAGGELTDEVRDALFELGLTEEEIDMFSNMQNRWPGGNMGRGNQDNEDRQRSWPGGNDMGGGQGGPGNGNGITENSTSSPSGNGTASPLGAMTQIDTGTDYVIIIAALLVLLVTAIIFVAKPQKNVI